MRQINYLNYAMQVTTSFEVIIHARTENSFYLERGIMLGDPLCPHIFIVCAEYLIRDLHFMYTQASFGIR